MYECYRPSLIVSLTLGVAPAGDVAVGGGAERLGSLPVQAGRVDGGRAGGPGGPPARRRVPAPEPPAPGEPRPARGPPRGQSWLRGPPPAGGRFGRHPTAGSELARTRGIRLSN